MSSNNISPLYFLSNWEAKVILCLCQAIDLEVDLWWLNFSINVDVSYHACVLCRLQLNFCSFFTTEGVKHSLQFTIVRPFSKIGRLMEFIPGMDGLVRPFKGFYHASAMFVSTSIITCTFSCIFFIFLITNLFFSSHIFCMHLNLIRFHNF